MSRGHSQQMWCLVAWLAACGLSRVGTHNTQKLLCYHSEHALPSMSQTPARVPPEIFPGSRVRVE